MRNNAFHSYIDNEVLTAPPLQLVQLLYRGVLDSIASARRYLKSGDIRARSRAITKAMLLVGELARSLNMAEGGEVSRNLAALYAYVMKLLIRANSEQSDPPLAEAEQLLGPLQEAWEKAAQSAAATEGETGRIDSAENDSEDAYAPLSCSY